MPRTLNQPFATPSRAHDHCQWPGHDDDDLRSLWQALRLALVGRGRLVGLGLGRRIPG